MDKFDLTYDGYQSIDYDNKNLIKNFIDTFWIQWQKDIIKFDNLCKEIKINNIHALAIWTYNCNEEFEYYFILKNNTTRNFYVASNDIKEWLIKNNLIKQ